MVALPQWRHCRELTIFSEEYLSVLFDSILNLRVKLRSSSLNSFKVLWDLLNTSFIDKLCLLPDWMVDYVYFSRITPFSLVLFDFKLLALAGYHCLFKERWGSCVHHGLGSHFFLLFKLSFIDDFWRTTQLVDFILEFSPSVILDSFLEESFSEFALNPVEGSPLRLDHSRDFSKIFRRLVHTKNAWGITELGFVQGLPFQQLRVLLALSVL